MNLLEALKHDEEEVLEVYLDSLGIRTGGVGHNLEAHGIDWPVGTPISQQQSDLWLLEDSAKASAEVDKHLPWAKNLDTARHDVLVNMAFNMGINGLLQFHRTLAMVEAGNYDGAAEAMLESKWAAQVGARARRLSEQMRTGTV